MEGKKKGEEHTDTEKKEKHKSGEKTKDKHADKSNEHEKKEKHKQGAKPKDKEADKSSEHEKKDGSTVKGNDEIKESTAKQT